MKGKSKLIFLIVAIVVLLLGGGSWYFFFHQSVSKGKAKQPTADEILATIVETQPITTNLKSGNFIQLQFKIQTSSVKAKDELTKRDFQVNNVILRLMSGMTAEQVTSPAGMAKFENQMKDELNKLMQNGRIVQIYTTNKMIQ